MSKSEELGGKINRQLERRNQTELAQEISKALKPLFDDANKVIRNRLKKVEEAVTAIEPTESVKLSEPVTLGRAVEIAGLKDDPAFVALSRGLADVVTAVNAIEPPKSLDGLMDAVSQLEAPLEPLSEQLNELHTLMENIADRPVSLQMLDVLTSDPKNYIPVRLTNGKQFYEAIAQAMGGGGGLMYGQDIDGKGIKPISVVESADTPGVFGMVVLNPDGSTLSTGGSGGPTDPDAAVDNVEMQNGDDLLLQNGDLLLTQ